MELIGWIGAALVFAAYALGVFGRLTPLSITYNGLNIVGAVGLMQVMAAQGNLPAALLAGAWMMIGLAGLMRLFLSQREDEE